MEYVIGRCRITDILASIDWTQQQLAEYSGLDKRTISVYATQKRKKMPLVVAVLITDAIETHKHVIINPRDLFEWTT